MNFRNRIIAFTLVSLLGVQCTQVKQEQLQADYLKDKIEDYKAYRWRTCQQEILKEAEARSDSFFVAMAKDQSFDSTEAPKAISRPDKPEVKIREDSMPLRPLLNQKSRGDSIKVDTSKEKKN